MRHHIVYWRRARREADVDGTHLTDLREQEARGELYIEFLDGERLAPRWDDVGHRWVAGTTGPERVAA